MFSEELCEDNEDNDDVQCEEYEEYEENEEDIGADEPSEPQIICAHNTSFPGYLASEIAERLIRAEESKAKNGLIVGSIIIFLGTILSISGVAGFINWSFSLGGVNSSLTNAAPGVVLMIIGLIIIIVTNHKITVQK